MLDNIFTKFLELHIHRKKFEGCGERDEVLG